MQELERHIDNSVAKVLDTVKIQRAFCKMKLLEMRKCARANHGRERRGHIAVHCDSRKIDALKLRTVIHFNNSEEGLYGFALQGVI